jgi:hypothetical protein
VGARWPENCKVAGQNKAWKYRMSLPMKVVQLGLAVGFEKFIKINAETRAQVFKRGHITNRRIEPHIEVFARRIGNFKAEIRRIAGNVPIFKPPSGTAIRSFC